MARYRLSDVLSSFAKKDGMCNPENQALRFTTLAIFAPKTDGGELLVELARAGLAKVFLERLLLDIVSKENLEVFRDVVYQAAVLMADEYIDIIQQRDENADKLAQALYHQASNSALQLISLRLLSQLQGNKDEALQKLKAWFLSYPDADAMLLMAWFKRPIPNLSFTQCPQQLAIR